MRLCSLLIAQYQQEKLRGVESTPYYQKVYFLIVDFYACRRPKSPQTPVKTRLFSSFSVPKAPSAEARRLYAALPELPNFQGTFDSAVEGCTP